MAKNAKLNSLFYPRNGRTAKINSREIFKIFKPRNFSKKLSLKSLLGTKQVNFNIFDHFTIRLISQNYFFALNCSKKGKKLLLSRYRPRKFVPAKSVFKTQPRKLIPAKCPKKSTAKISYTKNDEMNMFGEFQLKITPRSAKTVTPIFVKIPKKWEFHKNDKFFTFP